MVRDYALVTRRGVYLARAENIRSAASQIGSCVPSKPWDATIWAYDVTDCECYMPRSSFGPARYLQALDKFSPPPIPLKRLPNEETKA